MKPQNISPSISYNSVEQLTQAKGSVVFIEDSSKVFKDDVAIRPIMLSDGTEYMPWGADNMLPYNILDMIEKDPIQFSSKFPVFSILV